MQLFLVTVVFTHIENQQQRKKIREKYNEKKTLILQDGINNILKNDRSADEIFQEFQQLIDKYMDEFEPDNFVLCEVPPLKNKLENVFKNKLIDEFIGLLSSKYLDHASGRFVTFRLNALIRNVSRANNSVSHYNQIYDNFHLNYRKGIPYLKYFAATTSENIQWSS